MVGVSRSDSETADTDAETEMAVRNRSQYADTLHRPDPGADEPEPACPVCDDEADYIGGTDGLWRNTGA